MIQYFSEDMLKTYERNDLDLLHYSLGIELHRGVDGIFISQRKYTLQLHTISLEKQLKIEWLIWNSATPMII